MAKNVAPVLPLLPEELCYSIRRVGSLHQLVTRLVRGDEVLSEVENEPDLLAAQLGRVVQLLRKQGS